MLIIGCINVESALRREGGESLAGTSSSGKYAGVRGTTLRSAEVRLILVLLFFLPSMLIRILSGVYCFCKSHPPALSPSGRNHTRTGLHDTIVTYDRSRKVALFMQLLQLRILTKG